MATLLEKRSEALDTLDEWQELLTHFEISNHTFAYFPVLVPDESWAEVCQNKLSDYLSAQGKKLHILSFDNPEDFKLLTVRIFAETFAPNTEAVWITTPIPFDSEQLEIWKQAWRESMARLNQFRNKLTKNYPYTFLFVGGAWTHEITFNIAPDLWSIHSGIIRIEPPVLKTSENDVLTTDPVRAENKIDESIDVDFALRQAERLRGKKGAEFEFAKLLLNASKLLMAGVQFKKALEFAREAISIFEHSVTGQNGLELRNFLAESYNRKGSALYNLGKPNEAIIEHEKAIGILVELVKEDNLAGAYINKGNALSSLEKPNEAIIEYEKAIGILAKLVKEGRVELANILAIAYTNKGNALPGLGKPNEAIIEYEKAIGILAKLVKEGRGELADNLAMAYMNKGSVLDSLEKPNEAIIEHEKAIGILAKLVKEGRGELANNLAVAYINKGNVLNSLEKPNEAIIEIEKAIGILAKLVKEGRGELANNLAAAYLNKGNALPGLGKLNEAIIEYEKAIGILAELMQQGRDELANDLAMAYMNKGNALQGLGKLNEALEYYGEAINLWEETLQRREIQNLPNIATALGDRLATHRKAGNADLAGKDMLRLHKLLAFTKEHKEIEYLGESIQAVIDKRS